MDVELLQEGSNHEWQSWSCNVVELLNKARLRSGSLIVFVKTQEVIPFSTQLSETLGIPATFWVKTRQDASGYFFASESDGGALESYSTHFRFLIKHVANTKLINNKQTIVYNWIKLGFWTSWKRSRGSIVLCFDVPDSMRDDIRQSLLHKRAAISGTAPFPVHAMLLEHIVSAFDDAVWSCRDLIREREQNRPSVEDPKPDYVRMHEIFRHAIHSTEMLAISSKVIDSIIEEHGKWQQACQSEGDSGRIEASNLGRALREHRTLLDCFYLRSKALEDRLRNEINLTFHINAQKDSLVSARLAEAAKADSQVMKTIAVLGLIFLPGSYISTIFSMTFFTCSSTSNSGSEVTVSRNFWIYWVITVPLTVIILLVWLVWHHAVNQRPGTASHRTVVGSKFSRDSSFIVDISK